MPPSRRIGLLLSVWAGGSRRQPASWFAAPGLRLPATDPVLSNAAPPELRAWWNVMAAYRRVYDSRHMQADCQELGLAPETYAR